MNEVTPVPETAPTTQAAEGLPRFKWSLAQFERLIEHGIRGVKAKVYATLGLREYWVVDAVSLSTRVFREPGGHGYGSVADVPPAATFNPHLVPALAVSLGGLGVA